jgi:hypothetical protein
MSETMTRKAVVGDFARPNMSKRSSLSGLRFSVRQELDIPKIDETLEHISRCAENFSAGGHCPTKLLAIRYSPFAGRYSLPFRFDRNHTFSGRFCDLLISRV